MKKIHRSLLFVTLIACAWLCFACTQNQQQGADDSVSKTESTNAENSAGEESNFSDMTSGIGDPEPEYLGERVIVFNEYDCDTSFEDAQVNLQNQGFTVKYIEDSHVAPPVDGEKQYVAVREGETGGVLIIECDTTERARALYTTILNHENNVHGEHKASADPFQSMALVRINNCIFSQYATCDEMASVLGAFGLDIPEPTPLYRGGTIRKAVALTYEEVYELAENKGFQFYAYSLWSDVFENFNYLISPEGDFFVLLAKIPEIKPEDLSTDQVAEDVYDALYQNFLETFSFDSSEKMVVFSEGTFVIGSSYCVDRFMDQLEIGD